MIDDGIKFWETNKLPVQDFEADNERIRAIDKSKCYETIVVYKKLNLINISTWEKRQEWVCKFCNRPPAHKNLCYSDSRYDTHVDICDCPGAAKSGKHYSEIKGEDE